MLHVDAREIEARGLEQRQDRRVADHVDPGAELQLAARNAGAHRDCLASCRSCPLVIAGGPLPGAVPEVTMRNSRTATVRIASRSQEELDDAHSSFVDVPAAPPRDHRSLPPCSWAARYPPAWRPRPHIPPSDPYHRAVRARRRLRHSRAHHREGFGRAPEATRGRRKQAGRRRHDRRRSRREVASRRLHAAAGRRLGGDDVSVAVSQPALPGEGPDSGRQHRDVRTDPHRSGQLALQLAHRGDRRRPGDARQAQHGFARQRLVESPDARALQRGRGHEDRAHPVQGHRTCDQRPRRRAGRPHARERRRVEAAASTPARSRRLP